MYVKCAELELILTQTGKQTRKQAIILIPTQRVRTVMDKQRNREFQRGMNTDDHRRARQNKLLQLRKKQHQQYKTNKRNAFSRLVDNNNGNSKKQNTNSNISIPQQDLNDKNIQSSIQNVYSGNGPPISCYVRNIPVKVIDNVNDCQKCVNQLLSNNPRLLALDCEWKSMKTKQEYNRVSLLQLCDNNICLLLKMIEIEKSGNLPINLSELLENPKIVKVGLNISGDKTKLIHDYSIDVNGCVDMKQFILKNVYLFRQTMRQ